jgi:hypothetical protein
VDDELRKAAQAVVEHATTVGYMGKAFTDLARALLQTDTPNDHVPEFARGGSADVEYGEWDWIQDGDKNHGEPIQLLTYIRGLEKRLEKLEGK